MLLETFSNLQLGDEVTYDTLTGPYLTDTTQESDTILKQRGKFLCLSRENQPHHQAGRQTNKQHC